MAAPRNVLGFLTVMTIVVSIVWFSASTSNTGHRAGALIGGFSAQASAALAVRP